MEQRNLGSTALRVSALGFGCGSIGGLMVRGEPADQRRAVTRALDAGITYFDTAAQYGDGRSEENLGRTLRELDAWERVVVGTKVRLASEDRADPAAGVRRSLERSLRLLGRDAVDLLQLHNPTGGAGGGALPEAEALGAVAEALHAVVRDGLVRHVGFTGLGDAASLHAVIRSGRFASMQAYVNALNPSAAFPGASGRAQDFDGVINAAAGAGMGVIAIRVLAAGALSGSPERAVNAGDPGFALAGGSEFGRDVERTANLVEVATSFGLESTVELALRFALSIPGISTVLAGYSNVDQLEDAIRWAERGPLPGEAMQRVVSLAGG